MGQVESRAVNSHVSWAPRTGSAVEGAEQVAALHNFPPDAEGLFCMGSRMHRSATMRDRTVSLLVLQVSDLAEVVLIFGREAAERVVDTVMTELTHVSARRGYALRTGADTFALLMPDVSGEDMHGALQVRLGKACAVEIDVDGHELLLVPDVIARTLSRSDSVRTAFESLCRMLAAERHLNVAICGRADRELHDRTIPIPIAPRTNVAATPRACQLARHQATIPMGIAADGGRA
jgi:GGDEF domain-containing protein